MNQPHILRTAFTTEQLQSRIRDIGAQLAADYAGKELVLVAVLKGSLYFFADLTRAIDAPLQTDCIAIGMYGPAASQSGVVRITKDLDLDVTGKHVIIVEDIVRTGLTLGYLVQNIESRGPASVKVCALFVNPAQQLIDIPIAYQGFTVSSAWLMGYGMDVAEQWRHLPYVVEVEKNNNHAK
jgi:hypoxanthine phosphoribosyltransferase